MSFQRIGLDFLGGGMEGAGAGAGVAAGLKAAGFAGAGPYAVPLIAGFAGASALNRILAGSADEPAERMQMRLGEQQVTLNDQEIAARRQAANEARKAKRKNRALQDALSGIFGRYKAGGSVA